MTSTLADFWRMIWDLDCPTIVMVTKLEENCKVCGESNCHCSCYWKCGVCYPPPPSSQKKCERYWPSCGTTTYGNVQVTITDALNHAEYFIRTFSISLVSAIPYSAYTLWVFNFVNFKSFVKLFQQNFCIIIEQHAQSQNYFLESSKSSHL